MTSPEWEAANEDDSDRFPQPSPHVAPPAPVDPLQSDPARVARYAEAIFHSQDGWPIAWADLHEDVQAGYLDEAKVAIALADEEHAALVTEVERLRRGGKTLGEIVDKQCRMVLDATGLHDRVDEDGDGDWGAIWDHLFVLRSRAEAAEAKVAKAEALADEWEAHLSEFGVITEWDEGASRVYTELRAVIDSPEAPAALTPDQIAERYPRLAAGKAQRRRAALADAPAEQRAEGGA